MSRQTRDVREFFLRVRRAEKESNDAKQRVRKLRKKLKAAVRKVGSDREELAQLEATETRMKEKLIRAKLGRDEQVSEHERLSKELSAARGELQQLRKTAISVDQQYGDQVLAFQQRYDEHLVLEAKAEKLAKSLVKLNKERNQFYKEWQEHEEVIEVTREALHELREKQRVMQELVRAALSEAKLVQEEHFGRA